MTNFEITEDDNLTLDELLDSEEFNEFMDELEDCHLHELVFRYEGEQAYKSGYYELLKLLS